MHAKDANGQQQIRLLLSELEAHAERRLMAEICHGGPYGVVGVLRGDKITVRNAGYLSASPDHIIAAT